MKKVLNPLLYITMALAALVRFAVYLQARDLFLDEVNVARNLYERNFTSLLHVLDYEQYAPPLFLWFSKINTLLFGYSELALRLFPYLSSILSILLLVYFIVLLIGKHYAIYPLALFAGGFLFIHYGTELKQYSSDFMITLLLLVATIKSDDYVINSRFMLAWILLGSFALWLSMPAVFVLFSIGLYWLIKFLKEKRQQQLKRIFIIGGLWLAQFVLYFYLILQAQISSDYLQNYHANSFLYSPHKWSSLIHDLKVLSGIISQAGGFTSLALISNSILLLLGSYTLIRKERLRSILLLLPVILLLLAGLLHKYALADRLVLFIQPIIFVLLAYGVYFIFQYRNKLVYLFCTLILIINVFNHQNFKFILEKFEIQEIHYALDKIESKQVQKSYDPIWVHNGAAPAFIFYTQMSPKKDKYKGLSAQGKLLSWDTDYNAMCHELAKGKNVWILMTNYFPKEKEQILNDMACAELISVLDEPGCLLLRYEKK